MIDFLVTLFSQFSAYCETAFIDATFHEFHSALSGWIR